MEPRSSKLARSCAFALGIAASAGCAVDFDTTRVTPPRGTLGRELYTVVCDRVGAQSLREDVTGASFHDVCHTDLAGNFPSDRVDTSKLPPLGDTTTPDGTFVPVAHQIAQRAHDVARVDALGRRRADLIAALDAAIPDERIPKLLAENGQCPGPSSTATDVSLHEELTRVLAQFVELYDDDTIPSTTRAMGDVMNQIKADPDLQQALARLDARQGYRPPPIALGVARPVLAYPKLVPMARALLALLVDEKGGPSATSFEALERVLYEELRTPSTDPPPGPLGAVPDPGQGGRLMLSRPRTTLEALREIVLAQDDAFATGTPSFIVRRDRRGYANAVLSAGPFVDGDADGLADIDPLGQFVTKDGSLPAAPFFTPMLPDGPRDAIGRAQGSGALLYDYLDVRRTFAAAALRDARPFFAVDPQRTHETAMNAIAALPALAGEREAVPVSQKTYPPDPRAAQDWQLAHDAPAPANLATTPVTLSYRAFRPETSPVSDLAYAMGQIAGTPEIGDLLAVGEKLVHDHPEQLASFVGLALSAKALGDKHPEAQLAPNQTFWDDLFVQLARVAEVPGLFEDILRAVQDPATAGIERPLSTYMAFKDDVSYDTNNLNGPSVNLTVPGQSSLQFVTPVDRTKPDSGENKSEMQRFLSLLHDTNGLGICTKDNAVVHVIVDLAGSSFKFDYPTDTVQSGLVCGIVGSQAPKKLDKCAVFGYPNVMSLLLDVLLDKAVLTVRDPCLNTLMNSPLANIVGGADKFLQQLSGVDGFSLHPNLRGFARLLYFRTPYPGLPEDTNPQNQRTHDFLRDTINPIESMTCSPAPYTAPDGTVFALRQCNDVKDVLRARDPDALFPVDELGFVPALRPIAGAFDKHQQPLLFADLFDVLHLHWGSSQESKQECDPSAPRTDARWCSGDGIVTYEPMLAELLDGTVFPRLKGLLDTLASIQIPHCTAFDPKTHLCTASTPVDGIHVVAEAAGLLFDPKRTPGLTDRAGNKLALRNDGTRKDPIAPIHLVTDAFDGIDAAFDRWRNEHPNDDRQPLWRAARSSFVDTFLAVDGQGAQAQFHDPTLVKALPTVLEVLRAQVFAHCPDPTKPCAWATQELPQRVDDAIRSPAFAAAVDLVDSVRADDAARAQIEDLVGYLLDALSANDAQTDTLSALVDAFQVLQDDTNLAPFERVLSMALAPPVRDPKGNVVRRGLADAGIRTLSRIFEKIPQPNACWDTRDPNHALGEVLARMVTPMGPSQPAPIEVITDVIADVNRADPSKRTKLDGADYGSIANETSEFLLDPTRGLEQVYSIIKQVTAP